MPTVTSASPLPAPLTEWEAKERAGRLAREKPRWRSLRLDTENPNATANTLTAFMRDIYVAWGSDTTSERQHPVLLVEAILAHPNAPPSLLLELIGGNSPLGLHTAALSRNPIAPFVILEVPTFWERMKPTTCQWLLGQANLPHTIVAQLTQHSNAEVVEAARMHIASAGSLEPGNGAGTEAVAKLVPGLGSHEMGVDFDLELLHDWGQRFSWVTRFKSALNLPLDQAPFSCDPWNRSPLDLLNHLACDGNRFVSWVAQTRLADPDLVFTWADEKTA